MGSELLKMADGFALVADSLRELARQAVEEAEAETKQEGRTEKGIADKNTAEVKANKKKRNRRWLWRISVWFWRRSHRREN